MRLTDKRFGIFLLAIAITATPAATQVRWDPASSVWFVTVHDDSGTAREMLVEPANRVKPRSILYQIDSGTNVVYRYDMGAESDSPQALGTVSVPCDPYSAILGRTSSGFSATMAWGNPPRTHCMFDIERGAGDSLRIVRVTSTLLGGLGQGIAVGNANAPTWPTGDPTEETNALTPLVDSLNGQPPNGLTARFPIGVPTHQRTVVAQTQPGLTIVRQELTAICAGTEWIPDASICAQLQALLPTGVAAMRQGRTGPASLTPAEEAQIRQRLNQFIQALVAGRNTTIHQNAFTILHVLARAVREPLIP